jgi:hypothetical protein
MPSVVAMSARAARDERAAHGLRRTRDRPGGVQRGELVGRVPGRRQDLVGVLAQLRPGRAGGVAGRAAELHRDSQELDRALGPGLGKLHHHLARGDEFGVQRLVEPEHRL